MEAPGSICLVSAATAYEISNKVRIGKWPEADELAHRFMQIVESHGFAPLPVTPEHALEAGLIAVSHRDPFDRLLAAQAKLEGIPLVTADPVFREFGVKLVW